jgi:hypothetical protein
MNEANINWVKNCINSCTNMEQLKTCEIIIALFKFRLLKDGSSQQEAYLIEGDLLETYINKESLLII